MSLATYLFDISRMTNALEVSKVLQTAIWDGDLAQEEFEELRKAVRKRISQLAQPSKEAK